MRIIAHAAQNVMLNGPIQGGIHRPFEKAIGPRNGSI